MERLNIPLKTGQATTRGRPRVVWPLVGTCALLVFGLMFVRVFVARATMVGLVPGASLSVDVIGQGALSSLESHLGPLPVMSDKPLTWESLLSHVRREVYFALLPSGQEVAAFRGVLSDSDKQTWQSYGISVKTDKDLVMLSNAEIAFSPSARPKLSLGALWPGFLGVGRLQDRSITVHVASENPVNATTTLAFVPLDGQESAVLPEPMAEIIKNRQGNLLLIQDEQGLGFRLSLQGSTDSQLLATLLKQSIGNSHPTTQTLPLADGTSAEELRSSTAEVQLDVTEQGTATLLSADSGNDHLRARTSDKQTVITNRQDLLDPTPGVIPHTTTLYPAALASFVTQPNFLANNKQNLFSAITKIVLSGGKLWITW